MQPVLQDRVVVSRVATLAAIDPERDLRSMPDGVAQALQPAERCLFGVRLGEAPTHGHDLSIMDKNVLLRSHRAAGIFGGKSALWSQVVTSFLSGWSPTKRGASSFIFRICLRRLPMA